MNTLAEENYLKAIYKLDTNEKIGVSTNSLAEALNSKPASVTDMLKKLSEKKLINYRKYQGVNLSAKGKKVAIRVVRKHRLWETFLVQQLKFGWDQVHDIAEQLEHIHSDELIDRLDEFLGNPNFDPHGDPIPDKAGNIPSRKELVLDELVKNELAQVIGVKDHSSSFLQYLTGLKVELGAVIKVIEHIEYDRSKKVAINNNEPFTLSEQVCSNLYVKRIKK